MGQVLSGFGQAELAERFRASASWRGAAALRQELRTRSGHI